jgi:hypothetical protein
LAKYCPNLEHLDFRLAVHDVGLNNVVNIPDLVALLQFHSLSSLGIILQFGEDDDLNEVI